MVKIVNIILTLTVTVGLMFVAIVVFGQVFDEIIFTTSQIVVPGHGEWTALMISRFPLIWQAPLAITIATIIWAMLRAVSDADYTREQY